MSTPDRRIWLFLLLLFAPLVEPAPAFGAPAPSLGPIAGTYYQGDGWIFRRFLEIRPDGTFEYEMAGDVRLLQAEARGTASVADGALILAPKTEKGKGEPVPRRLAIVRWGPRVYLMQDSEIPDFANMVNQGFEPRSDARGLPAYLRDGDWDKPVTGLPDLPAQHRSWLLARPIEGKVRRNLGKPLAFEIDLGSREGLKTGMKLTAVAEELETVDCTLTVVSTAETSSVVEGEKDCRGLPPGARVCSKVLVCHGLDD